MGIFRVEIIIWTVQISWHSGNCVPIVLNSVCLAHFDPRDFRNGVPFIGGLKWAGEERIFRDGLRSEFRVNARGAKEEDFFDTMAKRGVDDICLDLEVNGDEIGRVSVVGVDASYFCGCEDYELGVFCGEE